MFKRTTILFGTLLLALVTVFSSCAPAAPGTESSGAAGDLDYEYNWRMTTAIGSETDLAKACHVLADKIGERTEGRVNVTVYADAALGAWDLTNEMIQRGDIEMMCEALDDSWDPRIAIGYYILFFSNSMILSSLRLILLLMVFGNSSTNSISLGYLYGAVTCFACC